MKKNNKLSESDIKKIAYLARLDIKKQKIKEYQKQLESILSYLDKLNEVDTKKINPASNISRIENRFRIDDVDASLSQESVISQSRSENGLMMTDYVFEETG